MNSLSVGPPARSPHAGAGPIPRPQAVAGDLVALRRRLHRIPEVGLHLPLTQAAILDELAGLPLEISTGKGLSSITAVLRGAGAGPTVLLRADMDGLPVAELAPVAFASTNGAMHACGHDLHLAALVGALRILSDRRSAFDGTVVAMFQPGEEGHDGARAMLDEGVLAAAGRPVASYGIHVFSHLDSGVFSCRAGVMMGSILNLELRFRGRGGHAARPADARNPILAASLAVQAVQGWVTQSSSPSDPVVATVGAFLAGDAPNVIPDDAILRLSIRAVTSERAGQVEEGVVGVARSVAAGYGIEVDVDRGVHLPPTRSDAAESERVRRVVTALFGADRFRELARPEMIAEDFSYVLDETGGAFVFVGAGGATPDRESNHSPRAEFDDGPLLDAARMLAALAESRLADG
ncbi:M20 metallopeptidase family protein [Microbacterium sp. RD1]|uniref:M20 metallopeptidase family protein n=1 Tax=Microbacterium sp. RD1 TaxID=3457313 RepID=UPI003FA5FEAC